MNIDTETIPGWNIIKEDESDYTSGSQPTRSCHPLDQLSIHEIPRAARLVREHLHPMQVRFNAITLREPKKQDYKAWQNGNGPKPPRKAFLTVLEVSTAKTSEVLVNLNTSQVEDVKLINEVMPTLTLEDLDICERVCRTDSRVIEACREIGITDMSKIYVDSWAIGVDERWGWETRLQQGLVYYRSSDLDNQYAHPLDFSVILDTEKEQILSVDIRRVNGERVPMPIESHNYLPEFIGDKYNHDLLKPIEITQPKGVSFSMRGNEISWAGFSMHIGFNFREGIVLSDVRVFDQIQNRERKLFNRLSVVEMVVPYGCPDGPHHKKHAFDVGEYGTGLMTNPLTLGCDCKGAIHYMDAIVSTGKGEAAVIKNAICIHEEDNGLLYKHTDFRTGKVVSARDRKLIISQIFTAANYEYCIYHNFHLDGTYRLEMKLTGMLNTYVLHDSETAAPYGTEVAKRVTAHNHQHIFSLRIDPEIDGSNNTVVQSDAVASEEPLGSAGNKYGNGFYSKKTPLKTSAQGAVDYCHETSRTWDIINPSVQHPFVKKPVGYKMISRESPPLLAKPGSVVYKRGGFARKTLWVTPYRDYELFPAGDYVCQSTGEDGHPQNSNVVDWAARDENIENTDIVCYLQFGLTHFPRAEDFPIMPTEPVSIMLRASNFFDRNPALWVPPSEVKGNSCDTSSRQAVFPKVPKAIDDAKCCGGAGASSKL